MSKYGKVLIALLLLDFLTSMLGIKFHLFNEPNSFIRVFFQWYPAGGGWLLFASIQLLISSIGLLGIAALEIIRRKQLLEARKLDRYCAVAILLSLLTYLGLLLAINEEYLISIFLFLAK